MCKGDVEIIWVYREGRWYLNPLNMFGEMPPAKDQPVDFLAKHATIPNFEWDKLDTPLKRLNSLRATQQKTLELLKSCDALEFVESVASPVDMIKQAAGAQRSAEGLAGVIALMPKPQSKQFLEKQSKTITDQLASEPVMRLGGRVAIFEGQSILGGGTQWEFYEGRWRMLIGP